MSVNIRPTDTPSGLPLGVHFAASAISSASDTFFPSPRGSGDNRGRTVGITIHGNAVDDTAVYSLWGRVNEDDDDGWSIVEDAIEAGPATKTISTNTTAELGSGFVANVIVLAAHYSQFQLIPTITGAGTIDVEVTFGP